MANEITLTKANFEAEVLKSDVPVLVDFWAKWCMPCKMIAPALSELGGELAGKLKIGKVNVDEEGDLSIRYGIESIPALFVFHKGEMVAQHIGNAPKTEIEKLVGPYI